MKGPDKHNKYDKKRMISSLNVRILELPKAAAQICFTEK